MNDLLGNLFNLNEGIAKKGLLYFEIEVEDPASKERNTIQVQAKDEASARSRIKHSKILSIKQIEKPEDVVEEGIEVIVSGKAECVIEPNISNGHDTNLFKTGGVYKFEHVRGTQTGKDSYKVYPDKESINQGVGPNDFEVFSKRDFDKMFWVNDEIGEAKEKKFKGSDNLVGSLTSIDPLSLIVDEGRLGEDDLDCLVKITQKDHPKFGELARLKGFGKGESTIKMGKSGNGQEETLPTSSIKRVNESEKVDTDIPEEILDIMRDEVSNGLSFKEIVDVILDNQKFKKWFESEYSGNEFDLRQELEDIYGDVDEAKLRKEFSTKEKADFYAEKVKELGHKVTIKTEKSDDAECFIVEIDESANGEFIKGKKIWNTKVFNDNKECNLFLEDHPEYGVIGEVSGLIHVALNADKGKEIKENKMLKKLEEATQNDIDKLVSMMTVEEKAEFVRKTADNQLPVADLFKIALAILPDSKVAELKLSHLRPAVSTENGADKTPVETGEESSVTEAKSGASSSEFDKAYISLKNSFEDDQSNGVRLSKRKIKNQVVDWLGDKFTPEQKTAMVDKICGVMLESIGDIDEEADGNMSYDEIAAKGLEISGGFGLWKHSKFLSSPIRKELVKAWVDGLREKGYADLDIILYGDWRDGRHIADTIEDDTTYDSFKETVVNSSLGFEEVKKENNSYYAEQIKQLGFEVDEGRLPKLPDIEPDEAVKSMCEAIER